MVHALRPRQLDYVRQMNEYLKNQRPERLLNLRGAGTESLGAWFLGPKAENQDLFIDLITEGIRAHCNDRIEFFKKDPKYVTDEIKNSQEYKQSVEKIAEEYHNLLDTLRGSVPFFSYRYQAHMNWDLTIPGMLGYFSAMLYNQNNVAAEASPVTSHLEALVGDDLCKMLGFKIPEDNNSIRPWGHITCDGSVANLEAMWAARNLKYYPISIKAALENESGLARARDIDVPVPSGMRLPLIELDSWTLMNLLVDDVLAITQRMQEDYNISSNAITAALDPYLIQSLGFEEFNRRYISDILQTTVMGPSTKHYCWRKNAAVLGIGKNNFINIGVDSNSRMDVDLLDRELSICLEKHQSVLMVVAVLGSTEESAVDPLAKVVILREKYRKMGLEFAIHVDAAWGGYFASLLRDPDHEAAVAIADKFTPDLMLSEYVIEQYKAIVKADSVTIDPHKAGYIPYPAGGLCYRNKSMRNLVAFLAPEVYHGEKVDAAMGVFGIEGSKPGASAAAVYLSHRIIRPDKSGYGKILGKALFNSKRFYSAIVTMAKSDDPFVVVPVQQIPAEKEGKSKEEIDAQLDFIRAEIIKKENKDIKPEAMKLLKKLGSDQIIITYAFNFKNKKGELNSDPERANLFNQEIFLRLSLKPDPKENKNIPLIITTSQFEPEVYGEKFLRTFMKRLGVYVSDANLITMNFISSTTMCPWLTDTESGNFIPELTKAFRDTILKVALEFQKKYN
ncbi:L-aspartate/L-glutamate decarboxylase [uncultured archaeon]|nr:L-aspartate/L-glutamate decarboxylase [uncultured archaeon]